MFRVTVIVAAAFALLSPIRRRRGGRALHHRSSRREAVRHRRPARVRGRHGGGPLSGHPGFHTRGEMGGIWSPPIKLLDGIWFGVDGAWIGPATQFTSGQGYVKMALPGRPGLTVERTDFVPGESRGVLIGLRFAATGAEQTFDLDVQAHSELMSAYPWGETKADGQPFTQTSSTCPTAPPRATTATRSCSPTRARRRCPARPRTTGRPRSARTSPPTRRSPARPARASAARRTRAGRSARPSGAEHAARSPTRCDDTEYGKGAGGQLTLPRRRPGRRREDDLVRRRGRAARRRRRRAQATLRTLLADPAGALKREDDERATRSPRTRSSTCPATRSSPRASTGASRTSPTRSRRRRGLQVRETNAGTRYPPPVGTVDHARWIAAGFPDYPWLFSTDGEYTAFASVALGQFDADRGPPARLRDVSRQAQRRQRQGRPRGRERRHACSSARSPTRATRTRRRSSRAPSRSCGAGPATTRSCARCTPSPSRTCTSSSRSSTPTATAGPRAWATSSATGMGEEKLDNTVYTIRGLHGPRRHGRRPRRPRHRALGAAPRARPRAPLRGGLVDRERARLRRLARRPRQQPALPALLDRRDADGGRAHRRRRPGRARPRAPRPRRALARGAREAVLRRRLRPLPHRRGRLRRLDGARRRTRSRRSR